MQQSSVQFGVYLDGFYKYQEKWQQEDEPGQGKNLQQAGIDQSLIQEKHTKNPKSDSWADESVGAGSLGSYVGCRCRGDTMDKFREIIILPHDDVSKDAKENLQGDNHAAKNEIEERVAVAVEEKMKSVCKTNGGYAEQGQDGYKNPQAGASLPTDSLVQHGMKPENQVFYGQQGCNGKEKHGT